MTDQIRPRHTALFEPRGFGYWGSGPHPAPPPPSDLLIPRRRLSGYSGTFTPYDPIPAILVKFDSGGELEWATNLCSNLQRYKIVNPKRNSFSGGRASGVEWAGTRENLAVWAVIECDGYVYALVHTWYHISDPVYTGSGDPPTGTLDGNGDQNHSYTALMKIDPEDGSVLAISDPFEGSPGGAATVLYRRASGGVYTYAYHGSGYVVNAWDADCQLVAEVESSLGGAPNNFPTDYDWGTGTWYNRRSFLPGSGLRSTWIFRKLDDSFNVIEEGTYPAASDDRLGTAFFGILRNGVQHSWGYRSTTPLASTPPAAGKVRYFKLDLMTATYTWTDVDDPLFGTPYEGTGTYQWDLHDNRLLWMKPATVRTGGEDDSDDRQLQVWNPETGEVTDSWHVPVYTIDEAMRWEYGPVLSSAYHDIYLQGTIGGSVVLDMGASFFGPFVPGGLDTVGGSRHNPFASSVYLTGGADDFRLCRARAGAENPYPSETEENPGVATSGFRCVNLHGGSSVYFGL